MVDQLRDFADERLINGCTYCGAPEETKDHVPSRVFLDLPYPPNLPVVPACRKCNNGFSRDEEYMACLVESVVAGSTDPEHIQRSRIAGLLRRRPELRSRIEAAKKIMGERIAFDIEEARVRNVILKLARGHAVFELSTPCRNEPTSLRWQPLTLMSEEERDSYNSSHVTEIFGEIGSRGVQRLLVTQLKLRSPTGEMSLLNLLINDWVDVQDERYRYLAIHDPGEIRIKIVIREFLACEVSWAD